MRLLRRSLVCFAGLALLSTAARAEPAPSPLRLIPDKADLVFQLEQPRQLADTIYNLDLVKQFQKIDAIRELYDSTNARRFYQLVAYFESRLGLKWPDLLERLAGHGAAVGIHYGGGTPVLLVVQGKDEKLLQKFVKLALEVAEQELARQEAKERVIKGRYRDFQTIQIGPAHAALAGSALLVSNNATALQRGLDLYLDGGKGSLAQVAGIAEARKLLPPHPLAWGWLNLEGLKHYPQAKTLLAEKQDNVLLTIAFGQILDIVRRSPFVCGGLYHQDGKFLTTIRLPRGREGMPEKWTAFLPPKGQPASLPLLKPKNALLSSSFYYDLSQYWLQRGQLYNEQQVKTFEQFDKNSGRFLAGVPFSKLTQMAGPYMRFVVVQQTQPGYKTRPNQLFPAGALVLSMREPDEFSKAMETLLRATALFGRVGPFQLQLAEERHGDAKIIGYRFAEKGDRSPVARADVNKIRFNFSPSFVRVGNQFVISSTVELARELVDLLKKEAAGPTAKPDPAFSRTQIYASGGVVALKVFKDQLLTQTILTRAVSPQEAEDQVNRFIDLVGRLGVLQLHELCTAHSFRYDLEWQIGK